MRVLPTAHFFCLQALFQRLMGSGTAAEGVTFTRRGDASARFHPVRGGGPEPPLSSRASVSESRDLPGARPVSMA